MRETSLCHCVFLTSSDVVITSYGGGRDRKFATRRVLPRKIINQRKSYTPSDNAEGGTMVFVKSVLEECIRHEPSMPRGKRRVLDAAGPFASEIAYEVCCSRHHMARLKPWLPAYLCLNLRMAFLLISGRIQSKLTADFYSSYVAALGKVDKSFKDSITRETEVLLHLDDILSELAMIRRVQEDIRFVSTDWWDSEHDIDDIPVIPVNRWAERGDSKLKRLEDDASRARQSVCLTANHLLRLDTT